MLAQPGGRVPACSMPELSAVYRVLSSLRMACATDHCIRTTSAFRHQRHVLCVSWALQLAYHQQSLLCLYDCLSSIPGPAIWWILCSITCCNASRAKWFQHPIVEPSRGLEMSSVSATYLSGCCCGVSATADMVSLPTAPAAYLHQAQSMHIIYISCHTAYDMQGVIGSH